IEGFQTIVDGQGRLSTVYVGHGAGRYQLALTARTLLDRFHHIAITKNHATTTGRLYIDGVLISTNTSMTEIFLLDDRLTIGGARSGANYLHCAISRLFLFNKTLSASDIKAEYTSNRE